MHSEDSSAASRQAVAAILVRLLPRLIRTLAAELHRVPSAGGLSLPQFRILCYLGEREYRPAELAAMLEIARPSLTGAVDVLANRGLVERSGALDSDRRGLLLRLTPAGRTLQEALQAQAIAGVAALLADASPDTLDGLGAGLETLEAALPDLVCDARTAALGA